MKTHEKIKSSNTHHMINDIFVVLLIIVTALVSFIMGRMSSGVQNKETLQVQYIPQQEKMEERLASIDTLYVASQSGTKYYPHDCKASERISEKNKIYFDSQSSAEKSGYTQAVSCEY